MKLIDDMPPVTLSQSELVRRKMDSFRNWELGGKAEVFRHVARLVRQRFGAENANAAESLADELEESASDLEALAVAEQRLRDLIDGAEKAVPLADVLQEFGMGTP